MLFHYNFITARITTDLSKDCGQLVEVMNNEINKNDYIPIGTLTQGIFIDIRITFRQGKLSSMSEDNNSLINTLRFRMQCY